MYHRVRYNVTTEPRVSIIIPTYNGFDLLERCVSSIYRTTTYRNFEIIVVDNLSNEKSALSYMEELARTGKIKLLRYPKEFNYSAINNFAVRHANGDVLVLLNNDTEVISGEWLTELVSHAVRPDVGAVGALLLFTDGLIQHAGVILGLAGVAGHDHLNHPSSTDRHFGHVQMTREVSAVTGACLAVRREVYHEVGGLDEDNLPVAFNDIDFCIRLAERGYRNIYTPFARLYHHKSRTRGLDDTPQKRERFERETRYMRTRHAAFLAQDPYYNPNLSLDLAGRSPSFPPRVPRLSELLASQGTITRTSKEVGGWRSSVLRNFWVRLGSELD